MNTFDNGDVRATVLTVFSHTAGIDCQPSETHTPTIAAGHDRRLTPVECERLQGFPDDWTAVRDTDTPQADSSRYRQLGNAVAVPVAQWILTRLVEADA